MQQAKTGRVKWFSAEKGYGFIQPDESSAEDVFVHYSGIDGSGYRALEKDARVSYVLEESKVQSGRLIAASVQVL